MNHVLDSDAWVGRHEQAPLVGRVDLYLANEINSGATCISCRILSRSGATPTNNQITNPRDSDNFDYSLQIEQACRVARASGAAFRKDLSLTRSFLFWPVVPQSAKCPNPKVKLAYKTVENIEGDLAGSRIGWIALPLGSQPAPGFFK